MKTFISMLVILLITLINISIVANENPVASSDADAQSVNAVWQQHEEKFHFTSIYNLYSCDGIESKVERLLKELGAREVKARATGCYEANGNLGKSLRVRVKFQSLSLDPEAQGDTVQASLQEVHIRPRHPRGVELGDCHLIDDLQDKILPVFEHEVIKKNRSCFPGQQSLGDVDWKVKVLKATG